MKMILAAALAALAAAIPAAPAAFAQKAPEPLESRLVARKVVMVDGRETLADAGSARPGDVIEYLASYRNAGTKPITGLQATVPIPSQTEFLPGTVRPAGALASADGRTFAAIPLKRMVVRDGRQVEEPVPYREYRALRWIAGELGGGKSEDFAVRVRVIAEKAPGETAQKGGGS